jgi:hypothetical protein
MWNFDSPNVASRSGDLYSMRRAIAAVGILVAFAVIFAFAPPANSSTSHNQLVAQLR